MNSDESSEKHELQLDSLLILQIGSDGALITPLLIGPPDDLI